jgi:hypothetical protein
MPICPVCRNGFDAQEPSCPHCGAPKPAHVREHWECSPFSLFCIWVARILFLLSCLAALIMAGMEVFNAGHRSATFFEIEFGGPGFSLGRFLIDLFGAATFWGIFSALGFATRRAIREY